MREVAVKPIVLTAVVIAAAVAAAIFVVFALLRSQDMPAGGARLRFGYDTSLAAPGLETAPQDELEKYRREKDAQLHSSGAGHIPIEDAMDRMVPK